MCVCVCEHTTHKYLLNPPTHHPKGFLWWWWQKDVSVWVIECCWSWPWAHPCTLSSSGRPAAEHRPEGTSLEGSSRTAAGHVRPSVSGRATPTLSNCCSHIEQAAEKMFNTGAELKALCLVGIQFYKICLFYVNLSWTLPVSQCFISTVVWTCARSMITFENVTSYSNCATQSVNKPCAYN